MGNLRFKRLASVSAYLFGMTILVSFQNCGFSGFITNVEEASSETARLSNPDGTTTDITTAPQGKLVHFEIPSQLVSMKISVIGDSQNQILGYSALLGKIIAFNSDGASYQEVTIPESQLKRVLSVTPYVKYSNGGGARYLYSNPGSVISYEDLQKSVKYGILQTKDRSWARLNFSPDCVPSVRSLPSVDFKIAYCTDTKTKAFFYQKIDSNGKPNGNIIQSNEPFETSGSVVLGNDLWVNQLWTKKLVLSTGVVSDLPASLTTTPMPSYYFSVYRPERNSIIYASYDLLGLKERNLQTGEDKVLLDAKFQYQINVIDENTFIIRDQDTGSRYIISGTAATAVSPISPSIMAFAMSSTQLAFLTPDPSSSSVRIDVKLYDLKTLAATSICTASMPSSSDFFGAVIGYSDFFPFFAGSIGSDPNSYGMGMSIAMDRTCTDLYMAAISSSRGENPKYTRTLYKYGVKSVLTRTLLNDIIPADGMGYFGTLIGIDNGSLYFTLQNNEVYASNNSGSLAGMSYGTLNYQTMADPEASYWNTSLVRVALKNGSRGYLLPLEDTGVTTFKLPRVKGTQASQFITNGGDNYILFTRESDSDTVSADAYSIQFYNVKNEMVKKEKFYINQKDTAVYNLPTWNRNNTQNPYVGFKIYSYVNDKIKNIFIVANMQNQTLSIIDPPPDVEFSWDTYIYPEVGLLMNIRAACSIASKVCSSNPFGAATSSDYASLVKVINGYYYFQLYLNGKSLFRRYTYNGNLGFTDMMEIGVYGGQFSSDNRMMVNIDYDTKKVNLFNLSTGAKQELAQSLDSVWFVKNGLMGYLREADETYSNWYIDLTTLKAEKIVELSGNKSPYYTIYSPIENSNVTNGTLDTVILNGQDKIVLYSIAGKKVIKTIPTMSSTIVWESGDQVVFGQTYPASYFTPDFKYKMISLNLKTNEDKEINISAFETIICNSSFGQQTHCIGKRNGAHVLMKYNNSKLGFDEITELNHDFNFGVVVYLNKNLSIYTFSAVNYIERYMGIGRSQQASMGGGWEAYLYKQ